VYENAIVDAELRKLYIAEELSAPSTITIKQYDNWNYIEFEKRLF